MPGHGRNGSSSNSNSSSNNNTPLYRLPERPPEIKQDDKFFSRLLAKEQSLIAAESPSFRVYYATAIGSVPFIWESQPGTPKHPLSGATLPPLSPPPSYYTIPRQKPPAARKRGRSHGVPSKLPLLSFLLRLPLVRRNAHVTPTSPVSVFRSSLSSSSSSSSFSSVTRKPMLESRRRRWRRRRWFFLFSSLRSPAQDVEEEDSHGNGSSWSGSPPTLCLFGSRIGRYRMGSVKSALRSLVGQRSE